MKIWKPVLKVEVAEHQRALLFDRDNFVRVIEPGVLRTLNLRGRLWVDVYDLTNPVFEHVLDEFLVKNHPELAEYLQLIELGDLEVGVVYVDGKLIDVLAPATRKLYWKLVHDVRVDVLDIREDFAVPEELLLTLRQSGQRNAPIEHAQVLDNHVGLLLVNGKLERELAPGAHAFWKWGRSLAVRQVDTRLQTLEVSGQEILSKDKVSLRLNLSAMYRVMDAVKAFTALSDFGDFLYKELQLALREMVGGRSLDEILASKEELGREIREQVAARLEEYGLRLASVGVKDIILPGEMKTLLNQVVEAEKQAQANLIRRREETAATRSLHNTARMLERSPTLLRLKELEALEKVTERIDKLTVYGGLDGVLNDLVKLRDLSKE